MTTARQRRQQRPSTDVCENTRNIQVNLLGHKLERGPGGRQARAGEQAILVVLVVLVRGGLVVVELEGGLRQEHDERWHDKQRRR